MAKFQNKVPANHQDTILTGFINDTTWCKWYSKSPNSSNVKWRL